MREAPARPPGCTIARRFYASAIIMNVHEVGLLKPNSSAAIQVRLAVSSPISSVACPPPSFADLGRLQQTDAEYHMMFHISLEILLALPPRWTSRP